MIINSININNEGYVHCKSEFYTSRNAINVNTNYHLVSGINKLYGEIDSNGWTISYLLSMYKHRKKDFVLFKTPELTLNGNNLVKLDEFAKYSCYMDDIYPLFSKKTSVRKLIAQGLRRTRSQYSIEEIQDIFSLDAERINRPVSNVGNEKFRAMAAIAFSNNKTVYCFPWMSKIHLDNLHNNILDLIETLNSLNAIIILPISKD